MLNLGGYYKSQPFISRPGSAPQAVPNAPKPQPAAPYAGASGVPMYQGTDPRLLAMQQTVNQRQQQQGYTGGPPGGYGGSQQQGIVPSLNLGPPQQQYYNEQGIAKQAGQGLDPAWMQPPRPGQAGTFDALPGYSDGNEANGYARGGAGIGIQNTGRGMAVNGGNFNGLNVDAPMGVNGIGAGNQQAMQYSRQNNIAPPPGINPSGQQMPQQANQQFGGGGPGRGFNPSGGPDIGSQIRSQQQQQNRQQAVMQLLQRMRGGGQQQQTQPRPQGNGLMAPTQQNIEILRRTGIDPRTVKW